MGEGKQGIKQTRKMTEPREKKKRDSRKQAKQGKANQRMKMSGGTRRSRN